MALKEVEALLSGYDFVRCSNSFLVNMFYVERVCKDDVYILGKFIPISRSRKKSFLDALAVYYGGGQ